MVKRSNLIDEVGADHSLSDLLLRGRVSAQAAEFRLIVSRGKRDGVDTLDIARI